MTLGYKNTFLIFILNAPAYITLSAWEMLNILDNE